MGTNFYLMTKSKEKRDMYFGHKTDNGYFIGDYELTDNPDWGYTIHIAKTSMGWLPLFQMYKGVFESIEQLKTIYDTGDILIIDEYGDTYDWLGFQERVLNFNGGKKGIIPTEEKEDWDGKKVNIPICHLDYQKNHYDPYCEPNIYFTSVDGYDCTYREFS